MQRDVDFDFIRADKNLYDPFFDGIKVDYKLKVAGNAYFKPAGNIFIGNDSTKPDALLSINPEQKIIMPNSARTFSFTNDPAVDFPILSTKMSPPVSNSDLVLANNINFTKPWFGEQTIETRILYLNSQSELTQKSAKLKIFYFPWKALLLVSPLIIVALFLVYFRFKR